MPNVARLNDILGTPGDPKGMIIATAITVFVNGLPVARVEDQITPHGDSPHNNAKMEVGSLTVFAEGKQVCRLTDAADCNHTVGLASLNVFAGG